MPFLKARNHLNLATNKRLGSNDLERIEVHGYAIESVRKQLIVDESVRRRRLGKTKK
jgi:hypothetical protein